MLRFLLNRREWLRVGGLGLLAGTAPASPPAALKVRAKSVLIVYTPGGMSHFETWDPKPDAPAEIRGAFGSITTSVPGIRFGEHMPNIAKRADRLTVLRSMSHDDMDHGSATYLAMTGVFHQKKSGNPPITPNDHPTYGAVLKRVRPERKLPYTAVHVNGPVLAPRLAAPGQFGGFLGRNFEPLIVGDVSGDSNPLADLEPRGDLPAIRLDSRRKLLASLDLASADLGRQASRSYLTGQAFDLLNSEKFRTAFDLDREPERLRDRYGRHRSGQACLLGRRMIEAGVPLVTVFFNHGIRGQDDDPDNTDEYGWDTHNDIFGAMKNHLLPRFDASFACLLDDLEQRGLLDSTLVVCMGEFGRAPIVAIEKSFAGNNPGRKHWAMCYSIALAGAGVRRGATYGASDKQGAYPSLNPVSPPDLAATMFASLGIDPASHFMDTADRPYAIASGSPVTGLFG